MRKHRIPTSWPQRNPRHSRFPIPNAVWEYQLKPIEFVILSYLCCQHSHCGANLSPEMVAKGVHKSEGTVQKYLSDLEVTGLITEPCSLAADFWSADGGKFFTLPNGIFLLNLPPSAFMVYAYLLLIEDRKTHTCHPSYNTIAADTGLSKNTALKSISDLLETGLITVKSSSYYDKSGMKWKGNNLYTILPIRSAVDIFHQRQLRQLEIDVAKSRLVAQSAV